MFEWARFGWRALDERHHDVRTGRGNNGSRVGVRLRTTVMYGVYDYVESTKMVG